jgi:putative ubiquitin-RnfH superfamily antitoxin RatB of RatAB toxin-antitoxin module
VPHDCPDILVEVVYALPQRTILKVFRLGSPATVADALAAAAADPDFSGIDVMHAPVGVYGQLSRAEQTLNPGDRVEIYRALPADPKTARRARAKQARQGPRPR